MDIPSPQTIILAATALGAALFVATKLWKGFKALDALFSLVQYQLKPNSGHSLIDTVKRIDDNVAKNGLRQQDMEDFLVANLGYKPRREAS